MSQERNPMHEAGAGEVGAILHNESKGGKVLGLERVKKENEVSDLDDKTDSGIIVGTKKIFADVVQQNFETWLEKDLTTGIKPLQGYVVDIFQIIFIASGRADSNDVMHYMKENFPIGLVIAVPEGGHNTLNLSPGDLIKITTEITQYGRNPVHLEWEEERLASTAVNSEMQTKEPPYYSGFIDEWQVLYGCAENLLFNKYAHNTRFILPPNEIKAILNKDVLINEIKKMIDEIKKDKTESLVESD